MVVFMGDSLTRYQLCAAAGSQHGDTTHDCADQCHVPTRCSLDLAYALHFGSSDHEQRKVQNPLQETTWAGTAIGYLTGIGLRGLALTVSLSYGTLRTVAI